MKTKLFQLLVGTFLLPASLLAQGPEKTFNEKYLEQVKENATAQARAAAGLLRKKYKGDQNMENTLSTMFLQHRMALEETALQYAGKKEIYLKLAEVTAKNDSIQQVFLRGAKTNGLANNKSLRPDDNSKFAEAIRLRKLLALSSPTIDSLYYHNNVLNDRLVEDVKFKQKNYEREILSKLLTTDQYMKLLRELNTEKASLWAQNDWNDLSERKLTEGMDKQKTIDRATYYYVIKLMLFDRYEDILPAPTAENKIPENPIPDAVRIIRAARQYKNPLPDKSAQSNFKW